ncbi:MAG: hypothetical protein QNJ72_03655 [Pleurocapsa sp. MO_226.B13]|nr:hypothetical protein [Pleurocapsa sp. MO_226.B13]
MLVLTAILVVFSVNSSDTSVSLEGNSQLNTQVGVDAEGEAGDITINTGSLSLLEESFIVAQTEGTGNPGNIAIDAEGEVRIKGGFENDDNSKINAQINDGGTAEAASEIKITANSLVLGQRALIVTGIQPGGSGNAGNITIDVGSLSLDNQSELTSLVSGTGNAGNITINAQEQISLRGTSKFLSQILQVSDDSTIVPTGNAGSIKITTPKLFLSDFAQISSNAQVGTEGNPGNIDINVDTLEATRGSTIDATTNNNSLGGSIDIKAENIQLRDGGKIVTSTSSTGNAGDITIDVTGDVIIDNANPFLAGNFSEPVLQQLREETGIFASTGEEARGDGGNINFNPSNFNPSNLVQLKNGGEISARAFGDANAGNLNINAKFIIAFPDGNNDIIANAQNGQGGTININARALFGIQERPLSDSTNDISAESEVLGLDGTVTINSLNPDLVRESRKLPSNVVSEEQTITQVCNANREALANNGLTIKGKGGIPPTPDSPLDSHNITIDDRDSQNTSSIPQPIETSKGKIQPAMGVKVTKSGEIILTAYPTNYSDSRLPHKRNCR